MKNNLKLITTETFGDLIETYNRSNCINATGNKYINY